jgi:hypothetical protein
MPPASKREMASLTQRDKGAKEQRIFYREIMENIEIIF